MLGPPITTGLPITSLPTTPLLMLRSTFPAVTLRTARSMSLAVLVQPAWWTLAVLTMHPGPTDLLLLIPVTTGLLILLLLLLFLLIQLLLILLLFNPLLLKARGR